tara:strand:+ start:104 stop:868 length:765 start_codon:yes stop_codon:yes gene_type:complete
MEGDGGNKNLSMNHITSKSILSRTYLDLKFSPYFDLCMFLKMEAQGRAPAVSLLDVMSEQLINDIPEHVDEDSDLADILALIAATEASEAVSNEKGKEEIQEVAKTEKNESVDEDEMLARAMQEEYNSEIVSNGRNNLNKITFASYDPSLYRQAFGSGEQIDDDEDCVEDDEDDLEEREVIDQLRRNGETVTKHNPDVWAVRNAQNLDKFCSGAGNLEATKVGNACYGDIKKCSVAQNKAALRVKKAKLQKRSS